MTIGAYTLTRSQISAIPVEDPVTVMVPNTAPNIGRPLREFGGGLYAGSNPDQPQVGDLRITFAQAVETDATIVAKQLGSSFEPYRAKAGSTVDLLRTGIYSADEMFKDAEQGNIMLTWGIRSAGVIMIAIGFGLMLKPFSQVASTVPVLSNIVGAGTGIIAFLLAGMLSMITIGIAWIFYRPLLGIVLLLVGCGAIFGLWHWVSKLRKSGPAHRWPSGRTSL